jgi:hypothetical protein
VHSESNSRHVVHFGLSLVTPSPASVECQRQWSMVRSVHLTKWSIQFEVAKCYLLDLTSASFTEVACLGNASLFAYYGS